jgi:hypothetical protein
MESRYLSEREHTKTMHSSSGIHLFWTNIAAQLTRAPFPQTTRLARELPAIFDLDF